jgi:hypothetical protein
MLDVASQNPLLIHVFANAEFATEPDGSATAPAVTASPFEKVSVPLWVLLPVNALAPFFSATFEDRAESATLAAGSETAPALTVRPFEKVSVPLCVLLPLKALAPFFSATFEDKAESATLAAGSETAPALTVRPEPTTTALLNDVVDATMRTWFGRVIVVPVGAVAEKKLGLHTQVGEVPDPQPTLEKMVHV